ncbi:winged helix DNA-binding domain-containing protein [Rhizophagus clarus]|uniref:Winged helix DNA-binding domain-containing protein n=1 Tax=Rhizophagus clarus TaxID=94130 RepID=A0A8H3QG99_9GLOM|nr:winged helix DNA-binding domain-containing protein [Rhizophagus clarus]
MCHKIVLFSKLNLMSLQPPSTQPVKMSSNTFVHKLYNMVVDKQYQHLIAWNYTGSSFIVCNIMEFSRDVLPKHFKHNNFSSFVRQLNMYGFHKVNKSPRGHRTLAENQIWEFSHPKFLRGRPDLLDDIKRKAMESETLRRETGDLHAHLAMMQVAQNELIQQIRQLQENFAEVMRDLADTKRKQTLQQNWMKGMWEFMQNQGSTTTLPFELNFDNFEIKPEPERPPIYITSPENNHTNMSFLLNQLSTQQGVHPMPQRPSTPLTAVNTPLPPSPSPGSPMAYPSDDEMDGSSSLYCSPGGSHAGSEYGMDNLWFHWRMVKQEFPRFDFEIFAGNPVLVNLYTQ